MLVMLYPDKSIKELLNMVKKHANMHSRILSAKEEILSLNISTLCPRIINSQNLGRLRGYLWTNWYNDKDWKNLFARSSYYLATLPLARTINDYNESFESS